MSLTWILDAKFGFVVAVIYTIATIVLHHIFGSETAAVVMISHEEKIVGNRNNQIYEIQLQNQWITSCPSTAIKELSMYASTKQLSFSFACNYSTRGHKEQEI